MNNKYCRQLNTVFKEKNNVFLFLIVSLVVYLFIAWVNNAGFLYAVVTTETLPISTKFNLLVKGMFTGWSVVGVFNYVCIVVLSFLFGMYAVLFISWTKKNRSMTARDSASGIWGGLLVFIGVGCSACGTLVIAPLLSAVGAAGLLSFLPLHGAEFLLLAIFWMIFSCMVLLNKMSQSLVCKI